MKIALCPIDTWFFRDSTPFTQGESPQAGVASVFPPHPPSVVGAIRAAVARSLGWDGRSPWRARETAVLGDGAELGPLSFTGPFVLRDDEAVFPLPRHVMVARAGAEWAAVGRLVPGPLVDSDLGAMRLPVPESPGSAAVKPSRTRPWVTRAGLQRILVGELPRPGELLDESSLWTTESRVGIARAPASRAVEPGMLYSTRHVRPRANVSVAVELSGLAADWQPSGIVPFGGEHRLAALQPWPGLRLDHLDAGDAVRGGRLTLVALTPLRLPPTAIAGRVPVMPGLRIASACVDRPLRVGGWSSVARGPVPLTNAVAPGATLFCQVDGAAARDLVFDRGLLRLGRDVAAGFGLCAVLRDPWKEIS